MRNKAGKVALDAKQGRRRNRETRRDKWAATRGIQLRCTRLVTSGILICLVSVRVINRFAESTLAIFKPQFGGKG